MRRVKDFFKRTPRKDLEALREIISLKQHSSKPLFEKLDLAVTAQDVLLTKPFVFVERMLPHIDFNIATPDWSLFGETAALTNGLQLIYDKTLQWPMALKANHDFGELGYNVQIIPTSTGGAVARHLIGRISFDKFSPFGYYLDGIHKLGIRIQDDLSSSANDAISVTFEGWTVL